MTFCKLTMTFCKLNMILDNKCHTVYNMTLIKKGHNMNKSMTVSQGYELVNAKYKLNSNELKFILIALSHIDSKDDDELDEYTIKLSELEEKLQAKQNETHLKVFAKKLMSKPLEVPIDGGFEIYNWFSKIRYKDGVFTVRIDKDLKPYLLKLKARFVSYNLKYIIPLTSTYSVRIYQLLKEHEKLTKRYFEVEELMELLQVPKSYRVYADFKRKVLNIAETELREHTDICFTLEEEKEGRKVARLIFRIYKNEARAVQEQAQLFDNIPSIDFSHFYGKDISNNGRLYLHIKVVTPITDGFLMVTFSDGSQLRFVSIKSIQEHIQ